MSRPDRFTSKVAFVTGPASGIGRAGAVAFAAEGAQVVILDCSEDALQQTAKAVRPLAVRSCRSSATSPCPIRSRLRWRAP